MTITDVQQRQLRRRDRVTGMDVADTIIAWVPTSTQEERKEMRNFFETTIVACDKADQKLAEQRAEKLKEESK